tara:strand:- start:883 stop:3036 length:2154 start_codon:yes stop_codon:yes gene_type:complete
MACVEVALPVPCQRCFTYLWPESTSPPQLGLRVQVPFARSTRVGIITAFSTIEESPQFELKTISAVLDAKPILSQSMLDFVYWASTYYHYPIGEVIQQCLPPALRSARQTIPSQTHPKRYRLTGTPLPKRMSNAAQALYDCLKAFDHGCESEHLAREGIQARTLAAAIKHGWVQSETLQPSMPTKAPQLTPEQASIVEKIKAHHGFQVHYIEGVTGSGKTYIYAHLIHQIIQQGQQALLLVPEIGLTTQNLARLDALCGAQRVCLHSELNDTARLKAWAHVLHGHAQWVVGTRSALFAPWQSLGCIIVDEAHDAAYKQQSGWRYSARDCAIMMGQFFNIPVILGSATPSLESLMNIEKKRYVHHTLTTRYANAQLPQIHRVDMRGQRAPIAPRVQTVIEQALNDGQQVLVFINRRGFSPILYCQSCQWMFKCPRCDTQCIQHQTPACMMCHQCGHQYALPQHCPDCQSDTLISIGFGSQRIAQWCTEQFPSARIVRVDRDSMRRKGALSSTLNAIQKGDYNLIIGTQMLSKGHDWPQLTVVVMVDADGALYSPDFRAMERFAQLYLQVSGRAGRAHQPGSVWIQTRWPQDERLNYLLEQGYRNFALRLLDERKMLHLPPAGFIAYLIASDRQIHKVQRFLLHAQQHLKSVLNDDRCHVLGPMPAWVKQISYQHRWYLMISSTQRSILHHVLKHGLNAIQTFQPQVKWSIDIDPIECP